MEEHLYADGPDPDVMPTAANHVTQATSGGEPTPGGVLVGLDADMINAEIESLFDASQLIESLGLESVTDAPRAMGQSRSRHKWREGFLALDAVDLQ